LISSNRTRAECWNPVTLCWIRWSAFLCLFSLRSYITENKICLNYKVFLRPLSLERCHLVVLLYYTYNAELFLRPQSEAHREHVSRHQQLHGNLCVTQSLTRSTGLYKIHTTERLLFATTPYLTLCRKKEGLT
jgi:hypothetical protein